MGYLLTFLFMVLWIFCTVIFILGMVNPKKTIIKFAKKGRKQVFQVWFISGAICFSLFIIGVFSTGNNENDNSEVELKSTAEIALTINENTSTHSTTEIPTSTPSPRATATNAPTPTNTATPTPEPTPLSISIWYDSLYWETEDAEVSSVLGNINLLNAIEMFTYYSVEEIKTLPVTEVSLSKMEQASWKYTGLLVEFKMEITNIASYPQNSDTANSLANGNVFSELNGFNPDSYDAYSILFVNGSDCEDYDTDEVIEVTAVLLGYIDGENAFGAMVRNMVFYTVPELMNQ